MKNEAKSIGGFAAVLFAALSMPVLADGIRVYDISFEPPWHVADSPPLTETNVVYAPTSIFIPNGSDGPYVRDGVGPGQSLEFRWTGSTGDYTVSRLEQIRLSLPSITCLELGFDVYVSSISTNYSEFFEFHILLDTTYDPGGGQTAHSFEFRGDGRFNVNNPGGTPHYNFGAYTSGAWHRVTMSVDLIRRTWDIHVDGEALYEGTLLANYIETVRFSLIDTYGWGNAFILLDDVEIRAGPPRLDSMEISGGQMVLGISDAVPVLSTNVLQKTDGLVDPQWSNVFEFTTSQSITNISGAIEADSDCGFYRILAK